MPYCGAWAGDRATATVTLRAVLESFDDSHRTRLFPLALRNGRAASTTRMRKQRRFHHAP